MRDLRCPNCGTIMTEQCDGRPPWTCPQCASKARPLRSYVNVCFWGTLGIAVAFFYLLSLRGWRLFVAAVVMWIPLVGLSAPLVRKMTPKLEPYCPPVPISRVPISMFEQPMPLSLEDLPDSAQAPHGDDQVK